METEEEISEDKVKLEVSVFPGKSQKNPIFLGAELLYNSLCNSVIP